MYTNSYIRIWWYPYKSNGVDLGGGGNVWWTAQNCGVKRKKRIKRDGATDTRTNEYL